MDNQSIRSETLPILSLTNDKVVNSTGMGGSQSTKAASKAARFTSIKQGHNANRALACEHISCCLIYAKGASVSRPTTASGEVWRFASSTVFSFAPYCSSYCVTVQLFCNKVVNRRSKRGAIIAQLIRNSRFKYNGSAI